MTSPLNSSWIPHALDLVESVAGSTALDVLETATDDRLVCLGMSAPLAVLSYLTPHPVATFALASFALWYGTRVYDYSSAKRQLIEKKLEQIAAASSGPAKALIIQSAQDEMGALSMRTHVEKVRELAKTHKIERVVVHNGREFLAALKPGQFDIVWLRAHGHPDRIEIGSGFELAKHTERSLLQSLANKVKHGGKLILECCSAGGGEKSIADHIGTFCWERTVYAPITKISGILGFEFDRWGYPQFNDGFLRKGKNVTRVIDGPEPRRFLSLYAPRA